MKVVSPKVTSVKDYLLFIHGMSGCDTKDISDTINDVWADQAEIGIASIATFTMMYGERKGDTLKRIRYTGQN